MLELTFTLIVDICEQSIDLEVIVIDLVDLSREELVLFTGGTELEVFDHILG